MNPKSWTVVGGFLALVLGMTLGSCGSFHPAPQIEITAVSPLNVALSDTSAPTNVQVTFANRNQVDAVVTAMQESIYNGDNFVERYAAKKMSFFIAAGVRADTTGAGGSILALTWTKATKIASQKYIGYTSKVIFYGEDSYGNGKTFSDSIALTLN